MEGPRVRQLGERVRRRIDESVCDGSRYRAGRGRAKEIREKYLRQNRWVSSFSNLLASNCSDNLPVAFSLVLAKYLQTIVRCRPIPQIGAEQVIALRLFSSKLFYSRRFVRSYYWIFKASDTA
jgi:hypothetical protein